MSSIDKPVPTRTNPLLSNFPNDELSLQNLKTELDKVVKSREDGGDKSYLCWNGHNIITFNKKQIEAGLSSGQKIQRLTIDEIIQITKKILKQHNIHPNSKTVDSISNHIKTLIKERESSNKTFWKVALRIIGYIFGLIPGGAGTLALFLSQEKIKMDIDKLRENVKEFDTIAETLRKNEEEIGASLSQGEIVKGIIPKISEIVEIYNAEESYGKHFEDLKSQVLNNFVDHDQTQIVTANLKRDLGKLEFSGADGLKTITSEGIKANGEINESEYDQRDKLVVDRLENLLPAENDKKWLLPLQCVISQTLPTFLFGAIRSNFNTAKAENANNDDRSQFPQLRFHSEKSKEEWAASRVNDDPPPPISFTINRDASNEVTSIDLEVNGSLDLVLQDKINNTLSPLIPSLVTGSMTIQLKLTNILIEGKLKKNVPELTLVKVERSIKPT